MGEVVITVILQALEIAVEAAAEKAITYVIKKVVDSAGRVVSQLVYEFDSDGDGVNDSEEVIYTLDTLIPDLDSGYCLVNDGDLVGLGMPQYELIDGSLITDYIDTTNPFNPPVISGNTDGYLLDLDYDTEFDDVLVPLGADFTGDGLPDFGWILDEDDNGIPDASPDFPFYPAGSDEYHQIVEQSEPFGGGIIIMSPDGSMTVYDPDGNLVREDYNEAYSLWLQDNAALDKPFSFYSVSEALLLIVAISAGVSLVGKLFKRRNYNGRS